MMNDSYLNRPAQIKSFLVETGVIEFSKKYQKEAYRWIEDTLMRFHYVILARKIKG